ncbi:MAG: polymer-forming cytoskeletal protein [Candidatus Ancaeobacter aquaticus]|nr:polymer-forming cytoskeletal protein [Candidatus Ancaeobacter aquaticus]
MWQEKTVNYKHFKPKQSTNPLTSNTKPVGKQKEITCPHCGLEQNVTESALSVFCKSCNKRITLSNLTGNNNDGSTNVKMSLKSVNCSKCDTSQQVPHNALSSFCKKCGNRINLQNYEIKSKFNGELNTCGTLFIKIGGDVKSDINVGNAVIEGTLTGKLIAKGKVELKSTAKVYGKIISPQLIMHDGALFVGTTQVPPDFKIPPFEISL